MTIKNPIQYTSRTYNSILNDINDNEELRDTPEWWKRLIAGSHDVLSMYENAIANQSFLRTAFTRQAVADLLALIDYELSPKKTSYGTLLYYLNADTVSFPKTILQGNSYARSQGDIQISSLKFEARSDIVAVDTSENFTTNYAVDNNLDVVRVYLTGEKVRVSSTSVLPAPLQVSTDYYVIKISDTEIRLANSILNAYKNTEISLTDDGTGTHTIQLFSVQKICYQQDSVEQYVAGKSDGITSWQKFNLQNLDIIKETIEVTINSVNWTRVDSLLDSLATNTHFLLKYNTDNSSYILFGNNTYGKIPDNFDIYVQYAFGGGLNSNVTVLNKINTYAGSDTDVLNVSNAANFTEGSEVENIEYAKIIAPMLLKTRDRFVTSSDGKTLGLSYEGIERLNIIKNAYGSLSSKVPIVPSGGGNPSTTLKTDFQEYLINRTLLEEMDIRVVDPVYETITPIVQIKPLSSYLFADIKEYVMLIFGLVFSELTYECQKDYWQNGLVSAIDFINNAFSFTFGESDYDQIEIFLKETVPVDFNTFFQESSVFSATLPLIEGVDYLEITSPAFAVELAEDEISTVVLVGTNFTEIT